MRYIILVIKMKKIGLALFVALLLMPIALAEENVTIDNDTIAVQPIYNNETIVELPDPGITPDSPLWGLERAMERIQLILTFDKAERAKLGLEQAAERLAEVQKMIEENKIEHAQKAQRAHDDAIVEVEKEIEELESSNSTEELEKVVELEANVELHRMKVARVSERVMLKSKGNLTDEQKAMIDDILKDIENKTVKLKIEIQNKKDETKLKVKVQYGKTDNEVDDMVQEQMEKIQERVKEHMEETEELVQEKVQERLQEHLSDDEQEKVQEELQEHMEEAEETTQEKINSATEKINSAMDKAGME